MVYGRICPICGMDFQLDKINEHCQTEHGYKDFKDACLSTDAVKKQAEIELSEMDKMKDYKAQQYDRIAEMFFMSCGVIEDGGSLRYIIDPETVAEELMKIIVQDIEIDREQFISRKLDYFNGKRINRW